MKKFMTVLLIFLILITANVKEVEADSSSFNVAIDGKNTKVYDVNLNLGGEKINSEFSPYIYKDRTFVPVRVIAEYFDSQVDWFQESKTVTIAKGNELVVISIDSTEGLKNGELITLNSDSIPKLVKYPNGEYKTMIPLRAVSELLGYEISWDQSTTTAFIKDNSIVEVPDDRAVLSAIKKVNSSSKNEQIKIKGDKELNYTSFYSQDKNILTIEIENSRIDLDGKKEGYIEANGNVIQSIIYKSNGDNSSKIEIQTNRPITPNIKKSNNNTELNISFTNKVTGIRLIIYKGDSAILVEGVQNSEYNVIKLNNPFRYVIDIKDASIYSENNMVKFDIMTCFVKEVRASQFVPDGNYTKNDNIVRIVLDSKANIDDGEVKIIMVDDDMVIIPKDSNAVNTTTPDIFDSEKIPDSPDIEDFEDVVIEEVPIRKPRIEPKSKKDVKIVIDAGHGGRDPGAISKCETDEKDLNIGVARLLRDKLEREGYTVIMTRKGDEYVGLYDRPNIANESEAHVFVSIHANSSINTDARGIETLYAPRDLTSVKFDAQYPLAKAIHSELMKATTMEDRGIKQRPDLIVLKHTEMSAVLVELGFMSNLDDMRTMKTSAFREACAEGLYRGIKNYIYDTYGY